MIGAFKVGDRVSRLLPVCGRTGIIVRIMPSQPRARLLVKLACDSIPVVGQEAAWDLVCRKQGLRT